MSRTCKAWMENKQIGKVHKKVKVRKTSFTETCSKSHCRGRRRLKDRKILKIKLFFSHQFFQVRKVNICIRGFFLEGNEMLKQNRITVWSHGEKLKHEQRTDAGRKSIPASPIAKCGLLLYSKEAISPGPIALQDLSHWFSQVGP